MTAPGEAPRAVAATPAAPHPRRIGLGVVFVVLVLLAGLSWWQPLTWLFFGSDETAWVIVLHTFGGSAVTAAAVATLRRRHWAWKGALAYGLITATLIAGLGPVLDLAAEERKGLWVGAALLLLIGGGLAWYLRRALPAPAE